jgi:uncharacterized protein with HEPN domain
MSRDEGYLLDMYLAAKDALSFCSGIDRSDFKNSKLHQQAVIKSLEIIGEAASRISESMKNTHQEIPWSEITGMRNRLMRYYQKLWMRGGSRKGKSVSFG